MKLEDAKKLALQYMFFRGLTQRGWTFKFDNSKTVFGYCNYREQSIALSSYLTPHREVAAVLNTILHEIAHALVGAGHGHNSIWRQQALALGCSGERCSPDTDSIINAAKWILTCDKCSQKFSRHRRTSTANRYHTPCGPNSKLILSKNTKEAI